MNENERCSYRELCFEYVTGECTDEERETFERHLFHCTDCQKEVDELHSVWKVLHADMERMEPPEDLKQQVMESISAIESGIIDRRALKNRFDRWKFSLTLVAAVLAIAVIGSNWIYQLFQEQTVSLLPVEQALNVSAAEIERLVTLRPQTSEASNSYGVACIVNNGDIKQFIVYVFGVDPTKGNEAYQVWLLDSGKRRSAGTFRVGEKGIGVLAMPLASEHLSFDAIGITLEPDDRSKFPRGKKVFGSL